MLTRASQLITCASLEHQHMYEGMMRHRLINLQYQYDSGNGPDLFSGPFTTETNIGA